MNQEATKPTCWCGNEELERFGRGYGACQNCGTLVTLNAITSEIGRVADDDTDFYGKRYWLQHQTSALNTPDIFQRSRSDLTERNLHWLEALLRLRRPPARVLDIGCSHGGFVALMRLAGFDAVGMEISPWVLDFARRTFGVHMILGPVEDAGLETGSFDVILMTDVLEHLADPAGTLRVCARALSPDGIFLIQTPCFDPTWNFQVMEDQQAPFLEMMMPDEHLCLFSIRSFTRLMEQTGFQHLVQLPAIFERYDMFFAASRTPLAEASKDEVEQSLMAHPSGRVALALLDLRARELEAIERARIFESDSSARMEQIETLTELLRVAEADRAARGQQITQLTALLQSREATSKNGSRK